MTSADAAQAAPRSANRAVPLHRADEVMAASWQKATLPSEDRAEGPLIDAHERDQDGAEESINAAPEGTHEGRGE